MYPTYVQKSCVLPPIDEDERIKLGTAFAPPPIEIGGYAGLNALKRVGEGRAAYPDYFVNVQESLMAATRYTAYGQTL